MDEAEGIQWGANRLMGREVYLLSSSELCYPQGLAGAKRYKWRFEFLRIILLRFMDPRERGYLVFVGYGYSGLRDDSHMSVVISFFVC